MSSMIKIWFVEHNLDAVMKRSPIGFLWILEIQFMICSVSSFSVILKRKCLVYSLFLSIYLITTFISFRFVYILAIT